MDRSSSPSVPQHTQPDGEPISIMAGAWAIPDHISTTICATRSPPQCLLGGVQHLPPSSCCWLLALHPRRRAQKPQGHARARPGASRLTYLQHGPWDFLGFILLETRGRILGQQIPHGVGMLSQPPPGQRCRNRCDCSERARRLISMHRLH